VDVRILGSTEVRHDGSPLTIRGAKPRQLLVLLAMRANRPVLADQLIEELWEGEPPPSAPTALRVHIGRLRQVLEPDRSPSTASVRLPAGPHGYLLRLEPDELDTERFERRILIAREANAGGDPASAIPHLTEAIDLWRGPALSDARDLSAVRSETTRLDEIHGVAFEELAAARLALGEHALVVDVLLAATELFPLREKLTAGLMVALYRSGRAAEALRAFAELARRLDEQLGVVPSAGLRKLEEDILLQRPSLDLATAGSGSSGRARLHPPMVRMIGRHKELQEVVTFVHDSPGHSQRLFLITGPAGIGKTTLINEVCDRVEQEGSRALVGACNLHPAEPYEPIGQILRQMVADHGSDGLAQTQNERSPIAEVLTSLRLGEGGAGASFRLNESVTATLADHYSPGTIIVLENLHWADRPTLLLLRHLLRHPALAHVPFLATYQDDDVSGSRIELIHSLAAPSQCRVERLRPFHDGEVRSLVHAIAPPENVQLLADHAGDLRSVTDGNPFFLRELLRELDEESVELRNEKDLHQALSTVTPEDVRALIRRRMERLTELGKEVLCAAATLSEHISTVFLSEICHLDIETVRGGIEECLAVRLLVEDLRDLDLFLFSHAMARNAVYTSIPMDYRIELHRRVADVLVQHSQEHSQTAAIALHYCEAAPIGFSAEAATYSKAAAQEAESNLMFAEAARWYEEAIKWSAAENPQDEHLGRTYLALGRAYANDKQPRRAREAFLRAAEAARQLSDSGLLVDLALALDGPWSSLSEFQALSLIILQEVLEVLDEDDIDHRVRVLEGIAAALYYVDHEREGQAASEAYRLASSSNDPGLKALGTLGLHRWTTHQPTARAERLSLSRSGCNLIAPEGTTGELFLRIQRELLSDLLANGELPEFEATLLTYERNAQNLGSPADIYWSMALRATEATLHGDLVLAEQLARGAALRGYELEQLSDGAFLLQRFLIRYQQDRLAEERAVLQKAAEARTVFQAGSALLATVLSESGRHDPAIRTAWKTLGTDGSALPPDVYWLAGLALFGGIAARGNDRDLQHLLVQLLTPCADHVVVFGVGGAVLGSTHFWLGLLDAALGAVDTAIDHQREALDVANRIDGPFWAAQSQMELSKLLCSRNPKGETKEAARLKQAALSTARQFSFARILR
jgi:DNA-binding SARP family transcriptional activator